MYVYILDINENPLMPTKRYGKVRRLLKQNLAKVVNNSLWNHYSWVTDKDTIEWIYGLYIATEVIMNNFVSVYDETDNNIYTTIPHELIYKIMKLIYDCTGIDIADFVNSFISGFNICEKVKNALRELYYAYNNNKNLGGNKNE